MVICMKLYQILLNLKENGYTHFDTNSPIIIN